MKRIIIAILTMLFLSLGSICAQPRKAIYVIDHEVVKDFDGSQIENKQISDYTIDRMVHIIVTTEYAQKHKIASSKLVHVAGGEQSGLYVISYDAKGKEVQSTKLEKRGENVSNDSYVDDEGSLYVLDGKVITASEFKNISTSSIAEMKVIKHKNDPIFEKYASPRTERVVIVHTREFARKHRAHKAKKHQAPKQESNVESQGK